MTHFIPSFTPEQEAAIATAVDQGKNDIRTWIANAWVPPTVTCFSALQDHVDANTAGGLCQDESRFSLAFPQTNVVERETFVHAANRVQSDLDTWLSSGNDRNQMLVEETIDSAIDAGVKMVQHILKVSDGDVAATYFMGGQEEIVRDYFRRYVNGEIEALVKAQAAPAAQAADS